MNNWLLVSVVGSIVLTLALNLLPMLFPKTARRAQEKMVEDIQKQHEWSDDPARPGPRIKVFFPWKAMLIGSVVLTVLINLFSYFVARNS